METERIEEGGVARRVNGHVQSHGWLRKFYKFIRYRTVAIPWKWTGAEIGADSPPLCPCFVSSPRGTDARKVYGSKKGKKERKKNESEKLREIDNRSSVIELSLLQRQYRVDTIWLDTTASRLLKRAKNLISILASSEVISLKRNENRYFIRWLFILNYFSSTTEDIYLFYEEAKRILDEYENEEKRFYFSVIFYLTET